MTEPTDSNALPVERAGYVALVGRPNVGKSTLLNALVGESLSIVTPNPETTRDRVMAVVTRPLGLPAQLVVVDTPGIHRPHRKLGEYMNAEARAAAEGADVVVMVVDAGDGHAGPSREEHVLEALAGVTKKVFLVINKIDKLKSREALLPLMEAYSKKRDFFAIVPIAAEKDDGIGHLLRALSDELPAGGALFADDTLTDRPEKYFVAERIREAVISETGAEVPYVTAVEIESYDERPAVPRIRAAVHVEREGQKKILVGAGGEKIKAIGARARSNIEQFLGKQVFLELWVQVTPDWTRNADALKNLGYVQTEKSAEK